MVTTAAPFGPAQPAFTTPLAHTTALASETKETLKKLARTNNKAFIGILPCFGRVCAAGHASQPHERNRSMYRRMLAVEGRKGGPGGPGDFETTAKLIGDAERVSGFCSAVEGGSVTEVGGCLLVGRWSRVGEMGFLVRDFG